MGDEIDKLLKNTEKNPGVDEDSKKSSTLRWAATVDHFSEELVTVE